MLRSFAILLCLFNPLFANVLKSDPVVLSAGANNKRLIFLDFYNESADNNLAFLSNSLGDAVNSAIKGRYRFHAIPAAQWKKYAGDRQWKPADFADTAKIRQMGRDLGADGVVYGKFKPNGEVLQLEGAILSVVDGDVLARESVQTQQDSTMFNGIRTLAEQLAVRIKDLFIPSDRGALWRAAALPGWGHFYKERRQWGYFWSISTGTAAAATLFSTTIFLIYREKYRQSSPELYRNSQGHIGLYDEAAAQAEFDRLEGLTNQWGKIALVSLITTAVFYAGNIFHAWYIQPDLGNISVTPGQAFKIDVTHDGAWAQGIRVAAACKYAF